jgi:hypothetical protein
MYGVIAPHASHVDKVTSCTAAIQNYGQSACRMTRSMMNDIMAPIAQTIDMTMKISTQQACEQLDHSTHIQEN